MDPNSSPWAYSYNRIIPTPSNTCEDFQHSHMPPISSSTSSSAQSLLIQAAHSSIAGFGATSGSFVPPNPMGSYNPVFQQIYHQATQVAVQPKPAHYASSAIGISQRQICLSATIEKADNCRSVPVAANYPSSQSAESNLSASSYYGENSSSNCTSSPATATTTPSWNTPAASTAQHISVNSFIEMQQPQHHELCQDEKVTRSKQEHFNTKDHSKSYDELIYIESQEQQQGQSTLQIDVQNQNIDTEENYTRPEEGFYTFVDGRLTYNIPAAALNTASLVNKLPITSVKVVTSRKHIGDCQESTQPHALNQIPGTTFPLFESPSLCSSVHSPPPAVNNVHNTETNNNSSQVIVYKPNVSVQQVQTSSDTLAINRIGSSNNNRDFVRNNTSSNLTSPAIGVAYSSVITSALQAHQPQLQHSHQHSQQSSCWMSNNQKTSDHNNKHNQKNYPDQSSPTHEVNDMYTLAPTMQIKHTVLEQAVPNSEMPQTPSSFQNQISNSALHNIPAHINIIEKAASQQHMQTQSEQVNQSKDHSVENDLASNNSLASQIQSSTKIEEIRKPIPQKKTPRKRQPKKTVVTNNNYSNTIQNNHLQSQIQIARQHQQEQVIQSHQQLQSIQLQENVAFYNYTNRWVPPKIEAEADALNFNNSQNSQQLNPISHPQPAHSQSPQTHSHISHYYPVFPQQIPSQYTCTNQNATLFNLNSLPQSTELSQQHQQAAEQPHNPQSYQAQNTSTEMQTNLSGDSQTYKVIVPNIEDELNFLSNIDAKTLTEGDNTQNIISYHNEKSQQKALSQHRVSADNSNPYHMVTRPTTVRKTGFMDSYLKFLQGERDDSPPPLAKSGRKFSYQKPSTFQTENTNNNKRKFNEINQPSTLVSILGNESSPANRIPLTHYGKIEENANTIEKDDGHQIKIISQTQIVPKKRLQAQCIAAATNQTGNDHKLNAQDRASIQRPEDLHTESNEERINQTQHKLNSLQAQSNRHIDPLALPPRREQSLRKAKSRLINDNAQMSLLADDCDEPEEFIDSDTDPPWTPQDAKSGDIGPTDLNNKPKFNRYKGNSSTKRETNLRSDLCTALGNDSPKKLKTIGSTSKTLAEVTNQNGNISTDNFKTGDFIVLRSDLVNDWPTIWQVDSKCILQKYEPFCQNGKMFYRNMSKYASWNLDAKKLYLKAPVRIQIQSHTETVVEFMRSELLADDTEQFIEKIMDDYLTFRDHFEIYIQTMISQVLDPSFLSEINREKDEYFLSSVKIIDDIMENCKRKLLSITPWTRSVIVSIETWPQCHVFSEWGQNNVNQKNCAGCHQPGTSVRFLLFGHPYNTSTMQSIPVDTRITYEKDIFLCRICAARADIFHKIAHEKYNLFVVCTKRVGEYQTEYPEKGSTEILNDLLAENNWVDELFRNMRNSWAEVESLERQKRFRESSR